MQTGVLGSPTEIGARIMPGGVSFRVWAPQRERVSVAIEEGDERRLDRDEDGYFSGFAAGIGAGARYRYRLDSDERLYPDPASRFQPDGPHGPSCVVDPSAYAWRDSDWPGLSIAGQILYEMHVGTFTPEGTWAAASAKLPFLKEMGVTCIEMMPVNDFPGRFGWGYDGVNLFAPTRLYGEPDDLKRFIDAAHAIGIGVILDVVYNHLGPDGNYLACFAADYFTKKYKNEWGEAINFEGPGSQEVRAFFIANAAYWVGEYHFDGLRLDATQSIFDDSEEHVIAAMARAARAVAGRRSIILVGENEPQHTALVRVPEEGGYGLDALWNDDFHHSAMVALAGRNEAYYEDHEGEPQEFISAAKYGYLFQGQIYAHQGKRRGTPGLDLTPAAMVSFVQNHDQIANSGTGRRCHFLTSRARMRAMTALLLLMPATPMLFQGQEFWASAPFFYFADHKTELAELVRKGRAEFLSQFPSIGEDPSLRCSVAVPDDPATFESCRLDWSEVERHGEALALHRNLLALRRDDPVFSAQRKGGVDGAVLGRDAFALRFFGAGGEDRLLLVNFGRDLVRRALPEPLVAPPQGRHWRLIWSSEDPAYGGSGMPHVESDAGWRVPAESAVIMKAEIGSDKYDAAVSRAATS
jgi:maltooligosyltrehalose trehalohydrolase